MIGRRPCVREGPLEIFLALLLCSGRVGEAAARPPPDWTGGLRKSAYRSP
jgi:hypothetical protein